MKTTNTIDITALSDNGIDGVLAIASGDESYTFEDGAYTAADVNAFKAAWAAKGIDAPSYWLMGLLKELPSSYMMLSNVQRF